jgi:hypothetical protein
MKLGNKICFYAIKLDESNRGTTWSAGRQPLGAGKDTCIVPS